MTAISQLNGAVALTSVATGDKVPITDVSDTTESANGTTKFITVANLTALKADYNAVRDETGTSFTLTASNHANRATYAANAAAIAVTWNTGHGMAAGDIGRIYQSGAGVVTISAGTGTVVFSRGVYNGVSAGQRSWIEFEYLGSDVLLLSQKSNSVIHLAGTSSSVTGVTAKTALQTISIPANSIGPNGWVELYSLLVKTGTNGTAVIDVEFGGTLVQTLSFSDAFHLHLQSTHRFHNNNSNSAQVMYAASDQLVASYLAPRTAAIDTTANRDLIIYTTPANASDAFRVHWRLAINYAA